MNRYLLAAALVLVSCVDNPYSGPAFDPDACSEFALLQQFGLGWGLLNHRVSTWDVRLDDDECLAERAEITHIGGDFSTGDSITGTDDAPFLKLGWQVADTDVTRVGVARVTIEAEVGPEGRATGTQVFQRDELNLLRYREVAATIDGLGFETGIEQSSDYPEDYDPSHGYTIRGFGAGVEVSRVTTNEIELSWDLQFQVENSADRKPHNTAVEHARVGARLDVLIIATDGVPVHERSIEYSMAYPPPEPFVDQQIDPPGADKTTVSINGADGAPAGFWGVSSFDFQYDFDGTCETDQDCIFTDKCADDGFCTIARETPGEYVREITVTLDQIGYDQQSGAGEFKFEGYTSNASRFAAFYALEYTFTGSMVWVQAGVTESPERVVDEFQTGDYERPLDPNYEAPPLEEPEPDPEG